MSIDALRKRMAWPHAGDIFEPSGAGPQVLVGMVREKIEPTLQRALLDLDPRASVRVGLLARNPDSRNTDAPIAVVCDFSRPISTSLSLLAHRLAWNFARAPLLLTIEPHLVRTWSCCESPSEDQQRLISMPGDIEEASLDLSAMLSPSEEAAHSLHWVRLATGDFFRRFPERFRRDGRADRVLLRELMTVRNTLKQRGLDDDTIHDLLARVVFAQFLFDRKDADGLPALNPSLLAKLCDDGDLTRPHADLGSILADYDEAYRFFRWLNDKFNGDLFPGKGQNENDREAEWCAEFAKVRPQHLQTLADFVGGQSIGNQRTLWRIYSFDVIPLEFISSIYQQFVTGASAHYTRPFLVDFMLDEVLPWDGVEWDLKVLDPACGSGIFLVKAYQRLVQRWKNAHPGEKPSTSDLRRLLQRNLFGIDSDPHAVRVASFSLYLAMCDEIDPKSYLKRTRFPRLRDRSLVHSDFFEEDQPGFQTDRDAGTYDLVVGNAPWGERTETTAARIWASHPDRNWPIADKTVGTLFLPKAAVLAKPEGRVCLIQPASSLLFNRSGPARRFRERLFLEFKVEEVVNLSALRFELFENATSPPCIITMRPTKPDDEPLIYISPKQTKAASNAVLDENSYAIVVEPHDISRIWSNEAARDPHVWTTLAWGGRRDVALVRHLCTYPSIESLRKDGRVVTCEGVIRGNRKNRDESLLNRRILLDDAFPHGTFLFVNAKDVPFNADAHFERPRTRSGNAFRSPQLIIKQGWTTESQRFQAAVTIPERSDEGIICSQSYVTVHFRDGQRDLAESSALTYNSRLAVYFLLLTSGRLASYRPEPLVKEVRSVPFVATSKSSLSSIQTLADVDARVRELFEFKDAEWALIEDLVEFTLPDFKGDDTSPGRERTVRKPALKTALGREPQVAAYCQYFIRVLKAGFGQDKSVGATIFQDPADADYPVRIVAIHLDWKRDDPIAVTPIDSAGLGQRLLELNEKFLQAHTVGHGGIFFQRVARIYAEERHGQRLVPTIYIVKPDSIRHWTRSAALRDADEVAADIQLWRLHASGAEPGK